MSGPTSDASHHSPLPQADTLVGGTPSGVHILPAIAESRSAFLSDLPELLKAHPGKWVAYRGRRRLGVAPAKRALYQQCLDQGLREDEFIVCSIEPDVASESDDPVDVG